MKVMITVHQERYPEKPGNLECTAIRKIQQNRLEQVDVYQLAKFVANKHSFYLGVHQLSDPQLTDISKGTFIQQQAFAVDVDHGNFTFEELQERLAHLPVKPCLIYKTYSYQEPHNRRWRIVFFADKIYTEPAEVCQINEYLIYFMGQDFREYGTDWLEKLDTRAKDCARIYFGGIGIAQLQDVPPANFDFVFESEQLEKVKFFKQDLKDAKDELKEAQKRAGGSLCTSSPLEALKTPLNSPNKPALKDVRDSKALAQLIIDNLETLALILPDKPYAVDYQDCYEFIDNLPLAMLLGVSLNQKFNCVLPHHVDLDPSAHILMSVDGKNQHVYRCFGCMDEKETYRAFSVIAFIFEAAFGYTLKQTLESIYTILDIQLGSRYQQKMQKQLLHDVQYLEKLDPEDAFNQLLQARRVKGFYKAFLMLGMSKVSFASMKKESDNQDVVFFASNSYLHHYMRYEWNLKGLSQLSSVNKKVNYLVRLGLLSKIDYEDLSPGMLTKLEGYISQAKAREEAQTGKKFRRNPDYYQINFLTPEITSRAVSIEKFEKKNIVRSVGQGKAQVTALYGSKRGKEIYRQSKEGLSKDEARFVKLATRSALSLLNQKHYFTEDELLKGIDPKNKYWKKSEKVHLSQKLLPHLARSFQLDKKRVTKSLREKYQVPTKITSHHHIMFSTVEQDDWDLSSLSS